MKIAPLTETDPWYGRIRADEKIATDTLTGVPIETTVEVELVEILHGGVEENFRPYLHLRGELTSAQPAVTLPYGVSDLILRRGSGLPLDAFYDFTHAQLADLVSKGYFSPAFRVPEEMSNIPWPVPAKANFLIVPPAQTDEPPLVFWSVQDQTELALTEANSGLELSAYFPDFTAEADASLEQQGAVESALAQPRSGASQFDAFASEGFEQHTTIPSVERAEEAFEAARATVPDGVFSRLVQEIQAKQPAPAPVVELVEADENAIVPGSAADVYRSRVEPGVDHVLSGEHIADEAVEQETDADEAIASTEDATPVSEFDGLTVDGEQPAPAVPAGSIDFGEPDEDLEPLSVQFGGISEDEHRRAIERRQARLRAEVAAIDEPSTGDDAQPAL